MYVYLFYTVNFKGYLFALTPPFKPASSDSGEFSNGSVTASSAVSSSPKNDMSISCAKHVDVGQCHHNTILEGKYEFSNP